MNAKVFNYDAIWGKKFAVAFLCLSIIMDWILRRFIFWLIYIFWLDFFRRVSVLSQFWLKSAIYFWKKSLKQFNGWSVYFLNLLLTFWEKSSIIGLSSYFMVWHLVGEKSQKYSEKVVKRFYLNFNKWLVTNDVNQSFYNLCHKISYELGLRFFKTPLLTPLLWSAIYLLINTSYV